MASSHQTKISASTEHERFADYFVICGLDEVNGLEPHQLHESELDILTPLQLSYKATILWHYPENEATNQFEADGIKMLCMPRGVNFQKNPQKIKRRFHSFLQTREDGAKFYGFVLTFYEKVNNDNIVHAMDTLFKMFQADSSSKSPARNPYSSKQPVLTSKGSFTFYDKEEESLYVSKCICLIMRKPFVTAARECLENILEVGLHESEYNLFVESYIYNALYEIPSPPYGRTMKYTTISGDSIIILNPDKYHLPYFDYSMKEVLMTLGFDNLVDLFTCMLLEHQILLLASDTHKLMLIAECLTILFFPLLWQHVYVPVLPPWLRHFLDAPVPFIMGLYYDTEEEKDQIEIPCEGSICLLDIDSNEIQLPQEIPELPGRTNLIKEIKAVADMYGIYPPKGSLRLRYQLSSSYQNISEQDSLLEDSDTNMSFNSSTQSNTGTWPRKSSSQKRNKLEISPIGSRKSVTSSSPMVDQINSVSSNWNVEMSPSPHKDCLNLKSTHDISNINTDNTVSRNSDDKNKNPRLVAMMALAEKVGITIKSEVSSPEGSPNSSCIKEGLHVYSSRALAVTRKQQHENELNIIIREIFANRFTQMLVDYEHFVILPQQSKEDWFNNREHMQNFDKASFLSDQSQMHLPFMTLFVETQGFASLIDMKIMTLWEDSDPRLAFFDKRIDKFKVKLGIIRSDAYKLCESIPNAIDSYVKRCSHIDHNASLPHPLKYPIEREKVDGYFPHPELLALMETKRKKTGRIKWSKRDKQQQQSEHISLNEALKVNQMEGQKIKEKLAEKVKKYMQDSKTLLKENASLVAGGNDVVQKTLSAFADKLLKECKIKTNRLVVLKLGQEAVELGHGGQNALGIEENTLIASLCDLLERVWSHGVQLRQLEFGKESAKSKFVQRMRQSKSALWSHLVTFYQKENERLAAVYGLTDVDNVTSDLKNLLIESNRAQSNRKSSTVDKFSENISRALRNKSPDGESESVRHRDMDRILEETTLNPTQAVPLQNKHQQELHARVSFLSNLKTILEMKEIKTDTGYARAWTRLTLEKKVLAKDLRILLSHKKILATRYKEYAFIRTIDEIEQFLSHLLSLSAVDFFCFTNGFLSTVITYKVHIVLGKNMGSATTGNTWIDVTGSASSTGKIDTPKGENEFRFKDKNLGILTSLRIGHDNSGISPGWFIEFVVVTNEVTGQSFCFQCGRWLAKNQDDGSLERLLVAEMFNLKRVNEKWPSATLCLGISDKATISDSKTDKRATLFTKKLTSGDIQEKVADAVNNIVKYFYKDSDENITYLLCGENGFCQALDHVFQHGYKSARLFGKKLFIWDFIEKLYDFYVNVDSSNILVSSEELKLRTSLCTTIQTINTQSQSIGKDQKFQLFICLGLRDHQLQQWFQLFHQSPVTPQMYECASFFRDGSLLNFLVDVLEALAGFNIVLDKSITRGI